MGDVSEGALGEVMDVPVLSTPPPAVMLPPPSVMVMMLVSIGGSDASASLVRASGTRMMPSAAAGGCVARSSSCCSSASRSLLRKLLLEKRLVIAACSFCSSTSALAYLCGVLCFALWFNESASFRSPPSPSNAASRPHRPHPPYPKSHFAGSGRVNQGCLMMSSMEMRLSWLTSNMRSSRSRHSGDSRDTPGALWGFSCQLVRICWIQML